MSEPIDLKTLRYATIKDVYAEQDHNFDTHLIVEFFDGRKVQIRSAFSAYPETAFAETPKVYLVEDEE